MHPVQSGDQDTAIETYNRALELNRRNVDAYVARGAAYANISQFTKAIADFNTAIGKPPHSQHSATCMTWPTSHLWPSHRAHHILEWQFSHARTEHVVSLQRLIPTMQTQYGTRQQSSRKQQSSWIVPLPGPGRQVQDLCLRPHKLRPPECAHPVLSLQQSHLTHSSHHCQPQVILSFEQATTFAKQVALLVEARPRVRQIH